MKIIDKTPLVNEKGQLSLLQRIQGMLQYGFSWPYQLAAQQAIITYFDRQLEKGYTLIRNHTLGQSGIMVPIILIGSSGIYVIQIAYERGRYEVKGESWNVASGDGYQPAPTNPVKGTIRMANAVKAFIERQGVQLPVPVEPVLIAGDPGLHVESVKAAIKVLMIDGIRSYVANLASGRPVLGADMIYELTERIINPRPARKSTPAVAPKPRPIEPEQPSQQDMAHARAVFETSQEVKPFLPGDYDFAMDDEESVDAIPAAPSVEASPAQPLPRPQPQPRRRRILGMTPLQLGIIAMLGIAFLCVLVVFAYVAFF